MSNQQIQMDLISEDRDPLETLIYALTRERRQENQQRISIIHAHIPQGIDINFKKRNKGTTRGRSILPTPANNKIPDFRKCG